MMKRFWQRSECERVREILSPYIDGRLSSLEHDAVSYHIEVCEPCRRELESLKLTTHLLRRLPPISSPRSFTLAQPAEVRQRTLLSQPALTWLRALTVAVAILFTTLLASDLGGLFVVQHGTEVAAPTSPKLTLPQGESSLPKVEAPLPEEGKALEEVSPGAPFAVEKRGLPPEAELTPQSKEGGKEGLAKERSKVSPPSSSSSPCWLRPMEVALGLLSGLLLGLLLLRGKGRLRKMA